MTKFYAAVLHALDDLVLFLRALETVEHGDMHAEILEPLRGGVVVLLRQNGGRGEQGRLLARNDGAEYGAEGDFGLSVPHVPADQAVHDLVRTHVLHDVLRGLFLVVRQFVGKARLEKFLHFGILRKAESLALRTLGIEFFQIYAHGLDGGFHPLLDAVEVPAAYF